MCIYMSLWLFSNYEIIHLAESRISHSSHRISVRKAGSAFCYLVYLLLQGCDAMATASVTRPGSAQTTEKSQLILKGNAFLSPYWPDGKRDMQNKHFIIIFWFEF